MKTVNKIIAITEDRKILSACFITHSVKFTRITRSFFLYSLFKIFLDLFKIIFSQVKSCLTSDLSLRNQLMSLKEGYDSYIHLARIYIQCKPKNVRTLQNVLIKC